jgi:hypothetical protein
VVAVRRRERTDVEAGHAALPLLELTLGEAALPSRLDGVVLLAAEAIAEVAGALALQHDGGDERHDDEGRDGGSRSRVP